jgi:hypothetical protein
MRQIYQVSIQFPKVKHFTKGSAMNYLYGTKRGQWRLVATFDSEQQLLSYARWATLESHGPQQGKFEQGSALVGSEAWDNTTELNTEDDPNNVPHNPTPSML